LAFTHPSLDIIGKRFPQVCPTTESIKKLQPFTSNLLAKDTKHPSLVSVRRGWLNSPFYAEWKSDSENPDYLDSDFLDTVIINTFAKTSDKGNYYLHDDIQHRAKLLFLNLAVTPRTECPSYNPETNTLQDPNLLERMLWTAQMYFGPVFKLYQEAVAEENSTKQATTAPTPPPRYTRKPTAPTGASPATQSSKTPTNSHTPHRQPPREMPQHRSFFELSVPPHDPLPEGNEGWRKRDQEITRLIPTLLRALARVDDKAKLLKYPADTNTAADYAWLHSLSPVSFLPKNKTRANRYLFNHWMKQSGERSTAKILIAHGATQEALLEAFQSEMDYDNCWEDVTADKFFLTLSPLQEADVISVGWLYGSSYTTNRLNLGLAINATRQLTLNTITVELRVKHIQSYPREKVEQAARVSAVHVYCAKAKHLQAQQAMHNLYNKKRKFNFPEEKRLQFIPDLSSESSSISRDVKAVATHEAFKEQQAVHLRSMERIVLPNVMRHPATHLAHFYQYNLHAVLMGLVDKRSPEHPIFLGLDQSQDNPDVWILTTRSDRYQEACKVAQKLGVIVSHQMGDLVWETWFTSEYRQAQSAAFLWDPTGSKYVARASSIMSDLRNTTLFRNLYEHDLPTTPEAPCVITNLSILLPGAFRTRSHLANVDGEASASTVQNKQDVLTSVFSVDPMDDLDFEYFNEEQEFQILGNPVRSNTPWNAAPAPPCPGTRPTRPTRC
jgi:hypothetical protein